jgi:hypothetical protein
MKTATIRVPTEWQNDTSEIITFIDNYAHHAMQAFKVSLVGGGQINWIEIIDCETFAQREKMALTIAVNILNDRVTNLRQDPSTAAIEANRDIEERSKEIDRVASACTGSWVPS